MSNGTSGQSFSFDLPVTNDGGSRIDARILLKARDTMLQWRREKAKPEDVSVKLDGVPFAWNAARAIEDAWGESYFSLIIERTQFPGKEARIVFDGPAGKSLESGRYVIGSDGASARVMEMVNNENGAKFVVFEALTGWIDLTFSNIGLKVDGGFQFDTDSVEGLEPRRVTEGRFSLPYERIPNPSLR